MPSIVTPARWKAQAARNRYRTSGTQILDPSGQAFYPFGANIAVKMTTYDYVFEWNP